MFEPLDARVCSALLSLAATCADATPTGPVRIVLTQDHLSEFVGGSRPSVNQVLQRLAATDAIELGRGRITVLDGAGLDRRTGGGSP